MMKFGAAIFYGTFAISILSACTSVNHNKHWVPTPESYPNISGTQEPFASEAVYFLLTDRFVDGDPSNNHQTQGGANPSFDIPLIGPNGATANVGYQGGDFQGIVNNAEYIRDLGFSAIWLSPVVDNPDEAFTGGEQVDYGKFGDKGKTGYHGYWGVNFFELDEHWPSENLNFKQLTSVLKQSDLKTVLDVVANHGSPSYDMPVDQPKYGELYDAQGTLVLDHQNLHPTDLTPASNPLHKMLHPVRDPYLAQLSNFDETNPELEDYLIDAYLHWIDQGADAFRLDTVVHMPEAFWSKFSKRIRQQHADFFMFGEVFRWDAEVIAKYTQPESGAMSVLDLPGRNAMLKVFENDGSDYAQLLDYLHLDDGVYANPYELMTFYDNHDMSRMNASDEGFIDAHNWLFTSRGIPVLYYGSEIGFMRGTVEHKGNRNYLGQEAIDSAADHVIYSPLKRIANLRRELIALQRGVQINLNLSGNQASFLRVYQDDTMSQTALVLLNKSDETLKVDVGNLSAEALWVDAETGERYSLASLIEGVEVSAHGARVLLLNDAVASLSKLTSQ
ncbi:MAG: alpha-amylase family glycosyl hydrolase [Cellvibrionaceae bacterium]